MIFSEFVSSIASKCELTVNNKDDMDIPKDYEETFNSVVNMMRNKIHRLNKIEIPYIEAVFNTDNIQKLNQLIAIPDGLVNKLSYELYDGKTITQLTTDEQDIIKVLIAYICLQIN